MHRPRHLLLSIRVQCNKKHQKVPRNKIIKTSVPPEVSNDILYWLILMPRRHDEVVFRRIEVGVCIDQRKILTQNRLNRPKKNALGPCKRRSDIPAERSLAERGLLLHGNRPVLGEEHESELLALKQRVEQDVWLDSVESHVLFVVLDDLLHRNAILRVARRTSFLELTDPVLRLTLSYTGESCAIRIRFRLEPNTIGQAGLILVRPRKIVQGASFSKRLCPLPIKRISDGICMGWVLSRDSKQGCGTHLCFAAANP